MPISVRCVDSALGRWTQTEWRPAPDEALAGVVEQIWDFEGVLALGRERNFPNGMIELIVQLDEPHRPVVDDVAGAPFPAVCMDGLQTTAHLIQAPAGGCRVLGVRLHPVGAFALLGAPLDALGGATLDLRDVVGRAAAELGERCHDARRGAERVLIAAHWTAERIVRGARCVDPAIAWAAQRIAQHDGNVSIAAIEDAVNCARGRFTAAFRAHVGVSPKRFARVVRFRRALALVNDGVALPDVALAAGYYDQPHMNAEFRAHGGLSPGAFLRAVRYTHSVSLAEAAP